MTETQAEADPRLAAEEEEAERWAHEEAPEREIDYARIKRWVIQRDGRDFIQYLGLVDLLHQESGGAFSISTRLEQAPTTENGMLAVVSATVSMGGVEDGVDHRSASGLGDASPGSVTRMMAPHLVRMAETRAKGRALRDLLNVGMVVAEELGPDGPAPAQPVKDEPRAAGNGAAPRPANQNQDGITIEGRWYPRDQVYGFYTQRAQQCRDRNLPIPQPMLNRNVALQTLVDKTQEMKRTLAQAGALAPTNDEGRP